ncbi:MAG: hypothetical protein ACRCZ0_07885 [Cetobacterium sp.]
MSTISFQERQNKIDQLEQKINVLNGNRADRTDDKSELLETLKRIELKIIEQEKLLITKRFEEIDILKIVDNLNNQIQSSQQNILNDAVNQIKKELQTNPVDANEQDDKIIRQMNEMKTDFETHLHKSFDQSEQLQHQFQEQSESFNQKLLKIEEFMKQQQIASDERNDKLDDLLDKVEDRNDKLVDLLEKVDDRNDKIDDLLEKV